jgi:DNA-3-methyladenine glycosylase
MKSSQGEKILQYRFYSRDTALVAMSLLGKILVRNLSGKEFGGIIVETEAYYGENDPASRAYKGKKMYNQVMYEEPGHLFIYNVHQYWMLNFVAHERGQVGGVLIRAINPMFGIEAMLRNRPVDDLLGLTSGPGRLTLALSVDKSLNGLPVTSKDCAIYVKENKLDFQMGKSHRIGVKRDLERKLRYYVKGDKFVSVKPK